MSVRLTPYKMMSFWREWSYDVHKTVSGTS